MAEAPPRPQDSSYPHRYFSLRKTDLLDTLDAVRHRDTDAWSVAATVDDQDSVISGVGGTTCSLIGSSRATVEERDMDDEPCSAMDGVVEEIPHHHVHNVLLSDDPAVAAATAAAQHFRLETLRDLEEASRGGAHNGRVGSVTTDDDKRSHSNAAEFGEDEGTRSRAADFDRSDASDDDSADDDEVDGPASKDHQHRRHRHHNVVNDAISAPPQPQPSFASVPKSFAELLEENEILHTQVRNLQIAQKHQSELIENLRALTGCNEEMYDQALHLSQISPEELEQWNQQSKAVLVGASNHTSSETFSAAPSLTVDVPTTASSAAPTIADTATLSSLQQHHHHHHQHHHHDFEPVHVDVVSSRTLTPQLARLAELVTRLIHATVDYGIDAHQLRTTFEQALFTHITESYFNALPFGTENQQLLNLAYADQIRRFQSTLGADFAKWYRRQTVQSLSLNPASKEYLQQLRLQMTDKLGHMLDEAVAGSGGVGGGRQALAQHQHVWDEILDFCTGLSLVIHGGDADVMVQSFAEGTKYNEEVMAVVGNDVHATQSMSVKTVISPLFIDEEHTVLLPARVILQ